MAHIHPTLPHARVTQAGGFATEMAVLERLRDSLPDAFTLFHSVDWMRPLENGTARGEIDIAVVNQAGDLMLLEVKAGTVDLTPQGIFKTYASGQQRNVSAQVSLQYGSMKRRLGDAGIHAVVHQMLVLPHMHVQGETAQWPRDRVVDASEYPDLHHRIQQVLGLGEWSEAKREAVLHFLANEFKIQVDVSSVLRGLEQTTSVLSSGLATWVPRITSPQGIYRVNATAGSGKTQLALRMLREASQQGLRAAYCCFNSPLAQVIAQRVPANVPVETFHHLARRFARSRGITVDLAEHGAFDRIATLAVQELTADGWVPDLDLLVIDEMQDLRHDWVGALLHRVKSGGRAYLLEDEDQALYGDREPFDIEGEVRIRSHDNARSPREVIDLIRLLRLTPEPVQGLNPYRGRVHDPLVYRSTDELLRLTERAVQQCLSDGFAADDIAVLTLKGRESSQLLKADRLGPWRLRKASGQRDEGGEELWTEGDILCETVHRFKGQAVGAVVLTEFEMDDDTHMGSPVEGRDRDDSFSRRRLLQRLYVGLTRAQASVSLVLNPGAEEAMVKRMQG